MVSAYLQQSGLAMGRNLVPADIHSPLGYFEDTHFVELERRMVMTACAGGRRGWPDWGFTEDQIFREERLRLFRGVARRLLRERAVSAGTQPWGWKDPRAALLLDFWHELEPGAFFLLIYRYPWEIVHSVDALAASIFKGCPPYAWQCWEFYNRHMLAFARRHLDRCVLVSANAFLHRPERLLQIVHTRFGVKLDPGAPENTGWLTPRNFIPTGSPADLPEAERPRLMELLYDLHAQADLPGERPPVSSSGETRISVVIPCFNDGRFLPSAIESVRRSPRNDYEIIVVNDGSTDPETLGAVEQAGRQGCRVLHQSNRGLPAARNAGIANARAPYILPLDSDNMIEPEYMSRAIDVLDYSPETGVVYANPRFFGDNGVLRRVPDFSLNRLLVGNYIDACAVFRKSAWERSGGYDEALKGYEDWEFWIRLAREGWAFAHLDEFLFHYRLRPGSMVTFCNKPEQRGELINAIVRKHRDLYEAQLDTLVGDLYNFLSQ